MLTIRDLTLTARLGGQAVDVLRGVNLQVGRGEVLGLVGESGAGKSMIGRVIAGQIPPGFTVSGGSVAFDGADLLAMDARQRRQLLGRRIAFIPQEPLTALNPVLTIGQTFGEHLMLLGVPAAQRRAAALAQLRAVQLPAPEDLIDRYPHQLSGGQCQRVLIAMAFAAEPSLIVADEPTTALDVVSQANVLRLLAQMQRAHQTAVLWITHDLRLAAHICDRVAVLYAGEQVEDGPARDVLRRPRHPYTWALQNATPDVHGEPRVLPALRGQMPGVSALAGLAGCRFAARCPSRRDTCEQLRPPLEALVPGHQVRCFVPCGDAGPAGAEAPLHVAAVGAVSQAPDAAPLVELQDVSLHYRARKGFWGRRAAEVRAVDRLSLTIRPGEFVGIVGESGSGKSSVARLIVGAEALTSGSLRIEGHDLRQASPEVRLLQRRHVQMIFQDPHSALNPRRSVLRLLTQAYESELMQGGAGSGDRAQHAAELRHDVGLPEDTLARFPSQLSGGQKQRVNIGRALCVMPRLVVADEIVSGLDVSVQAQILNLLLELGQRHGIALLLISHDLSVVRYLCSRVLVMQRGQVVEQGATAEVFARPSHAYTRSLLASVPPADPAVAWPPPLD